MKTFIVFAKIIVPENATYSMVKNFIKSAVHTESVLNGAKEPGIKIVINKIILNRLGRRKRRS
jgi:hypothetical protein